MPGGVTKFHSPQTIVIQFSQRCIYPSMSGIDSFPLCFHLEFYYCLHKPENDQEGKDNTKWVIKAIFQKEHLQLYLLFENIGAGF